MTADTARTHLVSALDYGAVGGCRHINHQWQKELCNVSASQSRSNTCKLADGGGQRLRYCPRLCRPGRLTPGDFKGTPRGQQPRHAQVFDVISQLKQHGGDLEHTDGCSKARDSLLDTSSDHRAKFTSQHGELGGCLENIDGCRKL